MTYLTQMKLNPARRASMTLLRSPQSMHAAVLASYPMEDPGRVLWRVDTADRQQVTLYIVGRAEPDLTHLVEMAGWPTAETWRTTDYAPFLSRLADGQRWRFRLTANPVRIGPAEGGKRGRVTPHVTPAQQEAWLRVKAPSWGFVPGGSEEGGAVVVRRSRDGFTKQDSDTVSGRRRVTISRVTFDGHLIITDAERLRGALALGMGRAKAYGCGLMTLAPERQG